MLSTTRSRVQRHPRSAFPMDVMCSLDPTGCIFVIQVTRQSAIFPTLVLNERFYSLARSIPIAAFVSFLALCALFLSRLFGSKGLILNAISFFMPAILSLFFYTLKNIDHLVILYLIGTISVLYPIGYKIRIYLMVHIFELYLISNISDLYLIGYNLKLPLDPR